MKNIFLDENKDDPNVWDMICEGKTKGCFQIEGFLGKTWCRKAKPRSIAELADVISIIRPGTLANKVNGKNMAQIYVDGKHGAEEVKSLYEPIDHILKPTYGIIVYQEQAMKIAEVMAGFSLQEADSLRKAIGKKKADLMKQVKEKFIIGCRKNSVPEEKIEEVFGIIEKSNRYSFNKSHAVGYAIMSYASAYRKCNRPIVFYKHCLRNAKHKIKPDAYKKQLVLSAKSDDIKVFGPSLKYPHETFEIIDDSIYFGICDIKSVGKAHLDKYLNLMKEAKNEYDLG